jgi:hypothetical protein
MDKMIVKRGIINALATGAYVTVIGLFIANANTFFGTHDKPFTPVVVLLLLVLSAAVCGSLLFGQPAMWYVDGKKKQALKLLGATLGSLAVITLVAMVGLAAF